MSRPVNTIRRAGTYHFRRVVPPRLRDRIHRRELIRSLKTATPAAAKLRAMCYSAPQNGCSPLQLRPCCQKSTSHVSSRTSTVSFSRSMITTAYSLAH